jgi:ABC-type multidrug transport system fused ATPase/permease subunit
MPEENTLKHKIKYFKFRFKIFLWYLFTEPIRNLYSVYINIVKILESLNKTVTWIYIALVFMIATMFLGQKFMAAIFLIALLFFILLWEWESGHFMYRYREHTKKRIKKKIERGSENGGKI